MSFTDVQRAPLSRPVRPWRSLMLRLAEAARIRRDREKLEALPQYLLDDIGVTRDGRRQLR
mgnify:CR=1 FL=1|jgi:uncharacterized protein YjiS (DUF1127 family)